MLCAIFGWENERIICVGDWLGGWHPMWRALLNENTCSIHAKWLFRIVKFASFFLCPESNSNKWFIFQRIECYTWPMLLFSHQKYSSNTLSIACKLINFETEKNEECLLVNCSRIDSIELLKFGWIKIEFRYVNWLKRILTMLIIRTQSNTQEKKPPFSISFNIHAEFLMRSNRMRPFTSSVDIELVCEKCSHFEYG